MTRDKIDLVLCSFFQGFGMEQENLSKCKDFSSLINLAKEIVLSTSGKSCMDISQSVHDSKGQEAGVSSPYLDSIFNILNGNNENKVYPLMENYSLAESQEIIYPIEKRPMNQDENKKVLDIINGFKEKLEKTEKTVEGINDLLEQFEDELSYIKPSHYQNGLNDISLYQQLKIVAACSSCLFDYAEERDIKNYEQHFANEKDAFLQKDAFLLCSLGVCGIQDFIYSAQDVDDVKQLKSLRARSLYLDIMMEYIVDVFVEKLDLSSPNVLYSGGGQAYLLLPTTKKVKGILKELEKELSEWLMEYYKTALYIVCEYAPCSGNDLRDVPVGSYEEIFKRVGESVSQKKLCRYSKKDILSLNKSHSKQGKRECKVCLRTDRLLNDKKCEICHNLAKLGKDVLNRDLFIVLKEDANQSETLAKEEGFIPLPFKSTVTIINYDDKKTKETIKKLMDSSERMYSKNRRIQNCRRVWIGDYGKSTKLNKVADEANGIRRLAVLRADIDDLGQAFVSGFVNKNKSNTNMTCTAIFSENLSLFFKSHVNLILEKGEYMLSLKDEKGKPRNAIIVYSGGDDIFIVGAWDDIIGFAIDLHEAVRKYTQGTLTISAGVGIYPSTYPISAMARESGHLEEVSKANPGKNAITLFDKENSYGWEEFISSVMGEKFKALEEFFDGNEEFGNSLLHNMLDFIRKRDKEAGINIARFAYLLARLRPNEKEAEKVRRFQRFSTKMYDWIKSEEDSRQLITALHIYIYLKREREEKDES